MSLGMLLLWLLVAVVIVFTAALVLPFAVRIEAVADGTLRLRIGVQPFGRFGPVIRLRKPRASKPKRRKPPTKPAKMQSKYLRRIPKAGLRFLSEFIGLIHVRRIAVDARFGCDDPADTGEVFGLAQPLLHCARGLPRTSFRVEPVFGQAMLAGRAALDLSFVPITLLPPAFRFGWAVFGPAR